MKQVSSGPLYIVLLESEPEKPATMLPPVAVIAVRNKVHSIMSSAGTLGTVSSSIVSSGLSQFFMF